jgi:hypothetical protein
MEYETWAWLWRDYRGRNWRVVTKIDAGGGISWQRAAAAASRRRAGVYLRALTLRTAAAATCDARQRMAPAASGMAKLNRASAASNIWRETNVGMA